MQQVEGGDLIVNLDKGSRSKMTGDPSKRDMHTVESFELARKLAIVCLSVSSRLHYL